jgi:hypothetical protein
VSTAPTDLDELLDLARELARGSHPLPGVSSARASCWVARQSLELLIDELLRRRDIDIGRGTARSRLIALNVAYADHHDIPFRAAASWWRLSAACHHHAFELSPTHAEAVSLVAEVFSLRDRMSADE